jgi:hypothetical protein
MTRTRGKNSEVTVVVTAPDDDVCRLPVTETRGGENPGDWVVAVTVPPVTQHTYTPGCDGFHAPGACPQTENDE